MFLAHKVGKEKWWEVEKIEGKVTGKSLIKKHVRNAQTLKGCVLKSSHIIFAIYHDFSTFSMPVAESITS